MDQVLTEGADSLKGSRRDLLAFAIAFVLGILLYVSLHVVLDLSQTIVTAAILLVMLAYAVFVAKVPQLRVRLDQAGDNAYYLGLLFTLTSMGFALYEFGVETRAGGSGVEQIISNFGIALASTVAGIFLRVILHQMRVDPADVESMTRIELSEASKRVRASMDTLYGDLGRFHDEVRQRTGDVVNALLTDASAAMQNVSVELARSSQTMMEATEGAQRDVLRRTIELTGYLGEAAEEAKGASDRLRAVQPPPLLLAKRLEMLSSVMETLTSDLEGVVGKFSTASITVSDASKSMSESSQTLIGLSKAMEKSQNESTQKLSTAVEAVGSALVRVGTGLERDQQLFADLEARSRASSGELLRSQEAATEVLRSLTKMAVALRALIDQAATDERTGASAVE